jgi:DNA-binding XRE family transcriptional regulator
VSRQTIDSIETGKYHPSRRWRFKMAALFQLCIEQIFLAE